MPYFDVHGTSKSSGRKLKPRRFLALHSQAAMAQAKKSGMVPGRAELLPVTHLVCDVAGASHDNLNGTDRQAIVKSCKHSESVLLRHEFGNRFDVHALQVRRETGEQIGYIPKFWAKIVIDGYSKTAPCECAAISLGVVPLGESEILVTTRLLVVFALAGTDPELVAAYLRELFSEPECGVVAGLLPPLTPLGTVQSWFQRGPVNEQATRWSH